MTRVLVINTGSSSLKLQIVDTALPAGRSALATALVERIGGDGRLRLRRSESAPGGPAEIARDVDAPDHTAGFAAVLDALAELDLDPGTLGVQAVGHRVVHGGEVFHAPVRITPEVERTIEELAVLAPLHNPANLSGIRAARALLPDLPHVAVVDTGFFHGLPAAAHTYAIDRDTARRWGLRRYGFHGTSHDYVSHRVAELLGRPYDDVRQIVLHLGNGASASAVAGGGAVETSMGLTPLEGLVMGTRPGDLDPGLVLHLLRDRGVDADAVTELLNRRSGLQGLAGVSDFREVTRLREDGDADAALAYDVVVHRLRAYVGAYWAQLGTLDAITFTAGIGENSPGLRADALATLGSWGVEIDAEANEDGSGERRISTAASRVAVFVVPTDEELAIARACDEVLGVG